MVDQRLRRAKLVRTLRAGVLAGFFLIGSGCSDAPVREGPPRALTPAPNDRQPERFAEVAELVRDSDPALVFLGDSITQFWDDAGRPVWDAYYGERRALNLGVGAERTENVLWRIERGDFDHMNPVLLVLEIGTNNTGHGPDDPADIAEGVLTIVRELRAKLPRTEILVLGIFPRGPGPQDPKRRNNEAANRILEREVAGEGIRYRDIGRAFTDGQGRIDRSIMPDLLHLSEQGYGIWAEAIEADVQEVLGDAPPPSDEP